MEALFLAYNRRLEEVQTHYFRYLYSRIDWQERLIGIKGARGVGKTTMLLQHIKLTFPNRSQAFYVSLDNIWFSSHTLSELVEYLYTHGVTHLFLDEVHKYHTWIRELKTSTTTILNSTLFSLVPHCSKSTKPKVTSLAVCESTCFTDCPSVSI